MPTGTERLVWAQGSPETLRAVSTTIRGTRVNLAAAICWENYMPLVRQALYSQNVNLYLAPTADGRDTWLPLLRTVAIEGRCFVVSSNMCVRGPGTGAGPAAEGEHAEEHRAQIHGGEEYEPRRRPSCVTEEGFEIALPSTSTGPSSSRPAVRRLSVFDDDGNEIVLPRSPTTTHTTTTTSTSNMPPTPAGSRGRSRSFGKPVGSDKAKEEFISRGGSAIVGPFGEVLAGPQWEDDEGLLCADVDFEDCVRGRLDLDLAGSYSRNDSFKFEVQGLDLSPLPY